MPYKSIAKDVFKKLFRIYAHVMYEYFEDIEKLGIKAHVGTTLKHLVFFTFEFKLLKRKEYEPLTKFFFFLLTNL